MALDAPKTLSKYILMKPRNEPTEPLPKGTIVENPDIHEIFHALGLHVSEDTLERKWPVFCQFGDKAISLAFDKTGNISQMRIE